MVGNNIKNTYICCFCDNLIISSNGNPTEIDMVVNFDKSKLQQDRQTFYCHMECFKEKLNNNFKIHFHLDSFISLD